MTGAIYLPTSSAPAPAKRSKWPLALGASLLAGAALYTVPSSLSLVQFPSTEVFKHDSLKGACVQAEPRMPEGYNVTKVWDEKDRIIKWLSEAVRISVDMTLISRSKSRPRCLTRWVRWTLILNGSTLASFKTISKRAFPSCKLDRLGPTDAAATRRSRSQFMTGHWSTNGLDPSRHSSLSS